MLQNGCNPYDIARDLKVVSIELTYNNDFMEQWEFQVGPTVGISSGDQVWAARYILEVDGKSVSANNYIAG